MMRATSRPSWPPPRYRHTVGVARSWHFISVYGFVLTGVFFVCGLLTSDQWRRLVPKWKHVLLLRHLSLSA